MKVIIQTHCLLNLAILNFDKIKIDKGKKYLLLGDMLELGKHSKKLHLSIGKNNQ